VRSSMCELSGCCKFTCRMFQHSIETLVGNITNLDEDEIYEKLFTLQNFEITFNRNNVVTKCTLSC
jgi:hypothetical protein